MTPERWERIGQLYHSALDLEPDRRAAFLDEECDGDDSLRREVESLIAADEQAEGFIAAPAIEEAANMLEDEQATSPIEEPVTLLVGRNLGHYEIVSLIGAGGMGHVYNAKDSKLGRDVAIKTLPAAFSADDTRLQRFRKEAEAAAALNHPNIATIYSVEEIHDHHFITMEYVEGETLKSLIPKDGLDLHTFLEWFIPLSDALTHAHEKGVVHRDIKPGNIMVTPEGVPKILDFGLARIDQSLADEDARSNTLSLTKEGQVIGTPAYMSPEQAEGKKVDHRSDIFSFGVVMYEALTGQRPFKGDSYMAIIGELLKAEPPAIADLKPETPFLLARLVARCMKKDRRRRYQTMREARAILEEAKAETEAGVSGSNQSAAVIGKTATGSRWLVGGLIALAVLLAAITVWSLVQLAAPAPAPITRFSIGSLPDRSINLTDARLSPDGRYLALTSDSNDGRELYLRSLDQFEARRIPGTEGALRPFFSPDSKWVGFFLNDNKIRKVSVDGGSPLTICDDCKLGLDATWTADDTIIVSASGAGLYRISASGGRPETLTALDAENGELNYRSPQALPDGKHLLFIAQTSKGSRIGILSLETGDKRYLQEIGDVVSAQYLDTGHIVFARSGRLMAEPFDADRLEITGSATPVLDGIFFLPNFGVASNGTLIYLPDTAMRENRLVLVDRAGQTRVLLEKRADYRAPRFSPDGKQIAVEVDGDIWVYEVESGRGIRLSFEGKNESPVWTPDGKEVVFSSRHNNIWNLYRKAADGSGQLQSLLTGDHLYLPYSWNPASRLLAVMESDSTSNMDILMLSVDDNKVIPFLKTPFVEASPRFSPDGRWIAYFSNESERAEVYVRPYPGPGGKAPVSQGGGMNPVWSADGREIFYRWMNKVYAVKLGPGPEFTAGPPRVLIEGRYLIGYDVSPDGQRFAMVSNEQGVLPSQLYVVLNWTEELKRLVPSGK